MIILNEVRIRTVNILNPNTTFEKNPLINESINRLFDGLFLIDCDDFYYHQRNSHEYSQPFFF